MIERVFTQFRKVSIIAVFASVLGSVLMFVIGAVKVARAYHAYFLMEIEAGTSLKINGYPIEIMQVKNNMVKTARVSIPQDGDITSPQSELPLNG